MSRQGTINKKTLDSTGLTGVVPLPGRAATGPLNKVPSAPGTALAGPVELKPSADAIRKRAYELYLDRVAKGHQGDERTDWIRAERELRR
jgi:hypothetical protein